MFQDEDGGNLAQDQDDCDHREAKARLFRQGEDARLKEQSSQPAQGAVPCRAVICVSKRKGGKGSAVKAELSARTRGMQSVASSGSSSIVCVSAMEKKRDVPVPAFLSLFPLIGWI